MSLLSDFISLIYPEICMACGNSLFKNESYICSRCQHHLPKTNFHQLTENPVVKLFWGRVKINNATSYYYFNKGANVQNLLHQLKYKGQKEVGIKIGSLYGSDLITSEHFKADLIIPVPLHPKKERKRGYNQSEMFALGLSQRLKIPLRNDLLFRVKETETQTKKSRFKRWENVEKTFQLAHEQELAGKHILLVDDVITTGATLEACAKEILTVEGTSVSIATIAFANL